MRRTRIVTREVNVHDIKCDVCKADLLGNEPVSRCHHCRADLCSQCRQTDPDNHNDYPAYYCHSCWIEGVPYRQRIEVLEKEIDGLLEAWKQMCKKEPPNEADEERG